jgi:membrane protein implicated in regulation of membrane protease activity
MNWTTFYLICFEVGFSLSLISFLMGALHWHFPVKWHLPVGGAPHTGGGLHGAHGAGHGGAGALRTGAGASRRASHSFFNASTILVFLAWFGGTGYLLTRYSHLWFLAALGLAALSGLTAAAAMFWFMVKVLLHHESQLYEEDYRLEGTVGWVNVPIRSQGTGEILYSQEGVRKSAGARSENGQALEKGTEIVITRYEKGIAYVRRWDEWTQ